MENEGRIAELLAESLIRLDKMVEQQHETNVRLGNVEQKLGLVESRTEKVENQLIKLNLQTVENTRAIFKLADKVDGIADLDKRVSKIEKVVFK